MTVSGRNTIPERKEPIIVMWNSLIGMGKPSAKTFWCRQELGTLVAQVTLGKIPNGTHESNNATLFSGHISMKVRVDQRLRRSVMDLLVRRRFRFSGSAF